MGYRCEDYPCCGCGPEGCIDHSRIVTCKSCGKRYHPDQNTETTCYACQPDPEGDFEDNPEYDCEEDYEPDEDFEDQ